MTETTPPISPLAKLTGQVAPSQYDLRALSYANSFDDAWRSRFIRTVEWMTGKVSVVRMIREFEKDAPYDETEFWAACLRVLRIKIQTPQDQLDNIPKTGPVVLVANHPHGMVDGMVLAEMIRRRRGDYRILTRNLLTGLDTVASKFLISVPFPDQEDAQERMVEMRRAAMEHLDAGGLVAVFPSGVVATAETPFGPVIEKEWNVFTSKLIRKSGATVVPCYFPGSNSRLYQLAHHVSATLRQSLLIHEIVRSRGKPMKPVIGAPMPLDTLQDRIAQPRRFMAWLRDHTLNLR